MAQRAASQKTHRPDPDQKRISTGDLPDFKISQVSEAMETERTFVMSSGREYTFRPQAMWTYRSEIGFVRGNFAQWAYGALVDPDKDAEDFLDELSRDIGRIVQYYISQGGIDRGEGSSSSDS